MVFQRIGTRREMATYCNYPASNGSCGREIADGREHCYLHGDSGGTPPGHGAPVGNDNAVGNSGGGAPKGNTNALKYGGWCDSGKLYDRLRGEAKEWVDTMVDAYADRYREHEGEPSEDTMREFEKLATMSHQQRLALGESIRTGVAGGLLIEREEEREIDGETVTVTTRVPHPASTASLHLSSRRRNRMDELNLLPQPK